MRSRFSENEFSDPMLALVSLKHTHTVEDFYKEFEGLLNFLQLPDDYALSMFLNNLKPEISKLVKLFYPKTLIHALSISKKLESLMFNMPKKPYIPYKNPVTPTNTYPILQPPPKTDLSPLLPTPKRTFFNSP